ncbi:hypothetical protein B2K_31510 [Paenibacillus mucilaginosus K02]|uniref:Uncharacterized protein n=1 Tax=Paenibacillus mucilaginosus K02 TaxID=997761 RepID=I0BS39_9BACL|nr:hypothetical protein B2K_31510 [Paenibacillus mucilaginosus K02]
MNVGFQHGANSLGNKGFSLLFLVNEFVGSFSYLQFYTIASGLSMEKIEGGCFAQVCAGDFERQVELQGGNRHRARERGR